MGAIGSGRTIRLVTEQLHGPALADYLEKRATRPMVLRPWNAECLVLRAADDRIAGRPLVEGRLVAGPDGQREWRVRHVGGRRARPDSAERERVGLWEALETVRREGRSGFGERTIVGVELVRVTARLLARVCGWPRLPKGCSVSRAAQLLGVSRDVVRLWIRSGKLGACCAGDRGVGAIHSIRYPRADLLRRLATRDDERRPTSYRSLMGQMARASWAAQRWREARHEEWLVRVAVDVPRMPRGGRGARRRWVCPSCGRKVMRVYLPAGPLARSGRTWSAWRLQCRRCTGLVSEAGMMGNGASDVFGLGLLKQTCGQMGGNEFRKYFPKVMSEEAARELAAERARWWRGGMAGRGCR